MHPEDLEEGTRFTRDGTSVNGRDFQTEFRLRAADGRVIWVRQIVHRDADADDREHFRGFLFDVTEAKLHDEERERSRTQLRELAARSQKVREEERMSIARELHDELGQALTMLKIDLGWLGARMGKVVPPTELPPLQDKLGSMGQAIDMTLQTVRRILSALRPPLLEELGLKDAIEWQVEAFGRRAGIRYELDTAPVGTLSQTLAITVFRIFQEILTNIARHAGATRFRVHLRHTRTSLVLRVEDNGCGISEEKLRQTKSFGILGMRERAWVVGGEVEVRGVPDEGTTVTLTVPLQPAPPPEDEQ